MIYKTPHKKLIIEQHESHKKTEAGLKCSGRVSISTNPLLQTIDNGNLDNKCYAHDAFLEQHSPVRLKIESHEWGNDGVMITEKKPQIISVIICEEIF